MFFVILNPESGMTMRGWACLCRLSGQNHKYGDAPRMPRRPAGKARGGRIPGVFNRRATQPAGMDRQPNAIVFMVLAT